jgi:hypothetical protein
VSENYPERRRCCRIIRGRRGAYYQCIIVSVIMVATSMDALNMTRNGVNEEADNQD